MSRSLPEWIAESDDAKIPPRVRLRVFDKAAGRCEGCARKLRPGDGWQADHIKSIINGGANRESNLQLLCSWCHKEKTAGDVAEKAVTYRKKSKNAGIRKPSRMAGSRDSNIKIKMDGTVVDRRTGLPIERGRNV
jgi:5-methylcytosine-specific restriction protein A